MPLRADERAHSVVWVCSDSGILESVALLLTRTWMARGEGENSAVPTAITPGNGKV